MTHGLDTSFLLAVEIVEHAHHAVAPRFLGELLARGDRVAIAPQAAFITTREFARLLFASPTIYLALPLVSAHWAVRGWAEPHYFRSFGLMPAGTVVLYTPRDLPVLGVTLSCSWMTAAFCAIFSDIARLTRWRRDYEASITRLLRKSQ